MIKAPARYHFDAQLGGQWKMTDNIIAESRADGTSIARFKPTPAHQIPDAMERLLILLLLYQAGYEVGHYISLEYLVEN